jgi:hypothetical protein
MDVITIKDEPLDTEDDVSMLPLHDMDDTDVVKQEPMEEGCFEVDDIDIVSNTLKCRSHQYCLFLLCFFMHGDLYS